MRPVSEHAEIPRTPPPGIDLLARNIRAVPITAPFAKVPVHVVKPPGIRGALGHPQHWLLLFHRRGRLVWNHKPITRQPQPRPLSANGQVFLRSFVIRKIETPVKQAGVTVPNEPWQETIRQLVPGVEDRRRSSSACILPLRLGWKAIGLAFLLRKPCAELDRLVPTDPARRLIGQSIACSIGGVELPVLLHRDLGGPDVKWL